MLNHFLKNQELILVAKTTTRCSVSLETKPAVAAKPRPTKMKEENSPMPAPEGNQNAAKPVSQQAAAKTFVYSTPSERKAWMATAAKNETSLSDWSRETLNSLPPPMPAHKMEPPFPYREMSEKRIRLILSGGGELIGTMRCRYVPSHGEFGIRVDMEPHAFTNASPGAGSSSSGWTNVGTFHAMTVTLTEEQTRRIVRSNSANYQFEVALS